MSYRSSAHGFAIRKLLKSLWHIAGSSRGNLSCLFLAQKYQSAGRKPPRARSKYAKAVDEPIRHAGDGGLRARNSQSNPAAVVRSVSAEAATRCDRRQRGPCQPEKSSLVRQISFVRSNV